MAENPLLPDAELRALHALLRRAAKAESPAARKSKASPKSSGGRKASRHPPFGGREALLAGTLQQLRPGDLLVLASGDLTPRGLLPEQDTHSLPIGSPSLPPGVPQLMLAAGMAAALPALEPRPVLLALLHSGLDEPDWDRALAWAQDGRLPLIVACADPSGTDALRSHPPSRPGAMTWPALSKVATRLKLPVLTVDGEDAVAVYRVMQESVLRARSGDGPALLWAVLPSPRELAAGRPPAATPVRRLERYLRTRSVTF